MTTAIFMVLDPITPGDHYTDGRRELVVARVVEHGGEKTPRKVWYRRADGRTFTLGASESWSYADDFLRRLSKGRR